MIKMSKREKKALLFAKRAHGDQKRKYTGEPYWTHLVAVRDIVATVPHDEDMLVASLLHDTVEDTTVTLDQIRAEFGDHVANLVSELTDLVPKKDNNLNREQRKRLDAEHTAMASPDGKTIKLADLIHNSGSILFSDVKEAKNFAPVYAREKKRLLHLMTEGDKTLWSQAQDLTIEYEAEHGVIDV